MKKIILCLIVLVVTESVFAEGIRFVENKKWKELLALAKKEKKLIFLDGYASWCGPCKYMQKDVFTSDAAGRYFNSQFINVKLDMEVGEGPALSEKFGLTAYPTLFFINSDGEVVHKHVGALDVDAFVSLGKDAANPEKQFFTVRKSAEEGTLKPAAFHEWIHEAKNMKEETDSILFRYISSGRYPLLEKEMLSLIYDHASLVPEQTLHFFYENRSALMKLLGKSAEEVDENLILKLRYHALGSSLKEDSIDFVQYQQIIRRFLPQKATSELQRMKIRYDFVKGETGQACRELALFIDKPELGLTAKGLADLVTAYADKIIAEKQGETLIQKIEGYKLLPNEKELGYYKDIALLWIYYHQENQEKIDLLTNKILTNDKVPKELKERIRGEKDEKK